jgi:hypothetical protein
MSAMNRHQFPVPIEDGRTRGTFVGTNIVVDVIFSHLHYVSQFGNYNVLSLGMVDQANFLSTI